MTDHSYMGFVGVTTTTSAIMRIFPAWAEELDLPTRTIIGHDIALGAPDHVYHEVIRQIRDDPHHRGALVTSHKMRVFATCKPMFDRLDDHAREFAEISSIAKRGSALTGSAKDPTTVRLAFEEFLAPDHFGRSRGHALCLGAGGAGAALVHQLAVRADAPARIIVTDLRRDALDKLHDLVKRMGAARSSIDLVDATRDRSTDTWVARLPPGSLIANATGVGKDLPGSPLGDGVTFPADGIVWDFNYRGDLGLLGQARHQQDVRGLRVVDGWRYFVHGWTQAISDVFEVDIPPERVDRLSDIADGLR